MPLAGDQPQTCQRDRPRKRTGQKLDTIPGSVDQQTTCARWRRWDFREAQTQMLRQADAQVFKRYSQMKLQMKREALIKLNRRASESASEEA